MRLNWNFHGIVVRGGHQTNKPSRKNKGI